MPFNILEDVSANVLKGLKIVKKAGANIVEYGVLQGDKAKLTEEREVLLLELGRLFYDMMLKDNLELDILQQKCEELMGVDEKICAAEHSGEKVAEGFEAFAGVSVKFGGDDKRGDECEENDDECEDDETDELIIEDDDDDGEVGI